MRIPLESLPDRVLSILADVSTDPEELGRCPEYYQTLFRAVTRERERRSSEGADPVFLVLPLLDGQALDNAILETFVRRDAFDVLGEKDGGGFFQRIARELIALRDQQKLARN